jgi:hypothetical protein
MANKIQIMRGTKVQLVAKGSLSVAELGYTTDSKDLFIGNDSGGDTQFLSAGNIPYNVYRQAIINGNFDVWQRGKVINNPAFGAYLADRFLISWLTDGGTYPVNIAHLRLDLTPSELPSAKYAYRVNTDGAGSGYIPKASYGIFQRIENGTAFLCGAGKKLTLTFWARSNIAGKRIGVSFSQRYGSGGSPSAPEVITGQVINLSAAWTKYKITINTNTLSGKAFGSNNDDYLQVGFYYQWGTDIATEHLGGGIAETFRSAGNIDIAQVQLVSGDVEMPYQPRVLSEELSLCQRYYQQRSINNASPYDIRPSMRISPTVTGSTSPYHYDAEI